MRGDIMPTLIRLTPQDSINRALAALPETGDVQILLAAGVYREKVELLRDNVELCGAGRDKTRIVFGDGAKEILPDGFKRGTFRTATLRTDGAHIRLRNLTIENDAAPREAVGQAIALYADGEDLLVEDCALLGRQDTLFTAPLPEKEIEPRGIVGPKESAPRVPQRHIYRRGVIRGDIDFIFGGADARFEDCDIVSIDGRAKRDEPYVGYVCAPSTPKGQKNGYVFARCRFIGDGVPAHSVYLARPWRDYAKARFVGCEIGGHVAPERFDDWNKPQTHETAEFSVE